MIYLDYAAANPMTETALDVYTKVAREFYGNPISLHNTGTAAAELVEASRNMLAGLIGGIKEGLYFTGGGSESNELALESIIKGQEMKGCHLITSVLEHSSIYNYFKEKERQGYEVTWIGVNEYGQVNPEEVKEAIRENTILVSIHYGNGELGTIQPLEKIGKICRASDVILHSDCAQYFGKRPLNLAELPVDSISISSSKIGGPKGLGAVYIRPGVRWLPKIEGTTHENGFRAGTLDVPGICAFAASAKWTVENCVKETVRLEKLRNFAISKVYELSHKVSVEGHPDPEWHLPHVLALRPNGMEGQYAMLEMNRLGIAISTGSACLVGQTDPPRAMKVLGRNNMEAKEFIRLSFGRSTDKQAIEAAFLGLEEALVTFYNRRDKVRI